MSFANLEFYGKKPENTLQLAVGMNGKRGAISLEDAPQFGSGFFMLSEYRSPRGFVKDLIRIALLLHIFFTTLPYS